MWCSILSYAYWADSWNLAIRIMWSIILLILYHRNSHRMFQNLFLKPHIIMKRKNNETITKLEKTKSYFWKIIDQKRKIYRWIIFASWYSYLILIIFGKIFGRVKILTLKSVYIQDRLHLDDLDIDKCDDIFQIISLKEVKNNKQKAHWREMKTGPSLELNWKFRLQGISIWTRRFFNIKKIT